MKSAGKRQESATFLLRSFCNVAMQFFVCCSAAFGQNDVGTAEKRMLQRNFCNAAFRKLQRNFRFACGMLQEWGLEGWGLGLLEELSWKTPRTSQSPMEPINTTDPKYRPPKQAKFFFGKKPSTRRVTPCAVKTCVVHPGFARLVGSCGQEIQAMSQGIVQQNARPGEQSEAPRLRWNPGQEQNPGWWSNPGGLSPKALATFKI